MIQMSQYLFFLTFHTSEQLKKKNGAIEKRQVRAGQYDDIY